jgi:hypothetical protein
MKPPRKTVVAVAGEDRPSWLIPVAIVGCVVGILYLGSRLK